MIILVICIHYSTLVALIYNNLLPESSSYSDASLRFEFLRLHVQLLCQYQRVTSTCNLILQSDYAVYTKHI